MNENDADDCQFPAVVEACQNKAAKTDTESYMPTQEGSPVFNPSYVLDIQHEKETEDEEYALFGTLSNSPTSSAESDSDDDEMDDDAGTLFKPIFNVEALNFFVNNEKNSSENVVDYFDEEIFSGTPIEDECLLISMYVHYIYLTQSNNFKRRMKNGCQSVMRISKSDCQCLHNLHNKIVYVLLRSQHSNMYFCVHKRSQIRSHKNAFCTLVYTTDYPENSWVH